MNSITPWRLDSLLEIRRSRRPSVFLHRSNWYMTLSRQVFTSGLSMLYVGPIATLPKIFWSSAAVWTAIGTFEPPNLCVASIRTPCGLLARLTFYLRWRTPSSRRWSEGSSLMPALSVTKMSVPTLAFVVPWRTSVVLGFKFDFHMTKFWSFPPESR